MNIMCYIEIMRKNTTGFTIVELLIVIVVLAVLAAIGIVAYTGVQQRARNAIRSQDIASIQKALELFRVQHGRYPYAEAPGTNLPAGFTPFYPANGGYSYSVATDDSWLRELRTSGFMSSIPKDPRNNNAQHYVYFSAATYGSCTEPVYAIIVRGWEGGVATMPSNSQTLNCNHISEGIYGNWVEDDSQAVFSNLDHPTGL